MNFENQRESSNMPVIKVVKTKQVLEDAIKGANENQRVIFECPSYIYSVELGEPAEVNYERTVVVSDFFGGKLPFGSILLQHKCWYSPVKTPVKAILSLAHVAGYRSLVYGLPEKTYPILFEHPENSNVLIATTPLSTFIEGRFAPKVDWQIVIGRLKAWLQGKDGIEDVDWEMPVRPGFLPDEELPDGIELEALNRNIKWFNNHMFFEYKGKIGVFEGFLSNITPSGNQWLRPKTRGDCTGEATVIPAIDWALNRNSASRKLSSKIMDNLFNGLELADNDPQSPTYGGLRYYEYVPNYYCDGRAPLACILSSELTGNYDYAKEILRNLLFLLRTTGPNGLHTFCLLNPRSFEDGRTWKYYHDNNCLECRPHYQSYMWAAFIQTYVLTGHEEFFRKAESALRIAMEEFPDFLWQNSITEEFAHLLMPLSFLARVKKDDESRQWLRQVAETLLSHMQSCGAIQELMGNPERGKYPSPASDEDYATKEASLIQKNGDTVADLIYTVNFAFAGLHEAFCATGDEYYSKATDKMADFLCRIQIKSEDHKYLDGAWMHAFDYGLWEFFGSPSDWLWGPWCVESGWTNTWISSTLALRAMNRSLMCYENGDVYKKFMPELLEEMSVVHDYFHDGSAISIAAPDNDAPKD